MANPLEKYGAVPADGVPETEHPVDPKYAGEEGAQVDVPENPLAKYGAIPADDVDENPLAKYGAVAADAPGADIDALARTRDDMTISRRDLDYIAKKHGVDAQFLWDSVGWYGALHTPEGEDADVGLGTYVRETGKLAAGLGMNVVASGIPQGLVKKSLRDESQRRALDDLERLIEARKPGWQTGAEIVGGLAVPAGVAGKLHGMAKAGQITKGAARAGMAGEAAGLGLGIGYAHSNEDNELESTLVGGGVGLALLGAVGAGGKLLGRLRREAPEAAEAIQREALDVEAEAQKAFDANFQAEEALERVVLTGERSKEVREVARENDLVGFLDRTTPEERVLLARLSNETADDLPQRATAAYGEDAVRAFRVVRESVDDLTGAVGAGVRRGGVDDVVAQEGAQHVRGIFRGERMAKYVDTQLQKLPESAASSGGFLERAVRFMSDLRYVTARMDRKLGTRITPLIDNLSANYNKFLGEMRRVSLEQAGLNKLARRAGAADGKFDLYKALEEPDEAITKYTPRQRDAILAWRSAFEAQRVRATELGLPITKFQGPEGGNYVPHQTVDPVQYVLRMEERAAELGLKLEKTRKGAYLDLDDAKLQSILARAEAGEVPAAEFVQGLKLVVGGNVKGAGGMRMALNQMLDGSRLGHRLETVAGSSLEREGHIPQFLRETDVAKLYQKWAHNTFRHAYLRGDIQSLRVVAKALAKKDPEAAAYIQRHIEDLVGVRDGSAAAAQGRLFNSLQLKLLRAARRAGNGPTGWLIRGAAKFPDLVAALQAQVYPFALGLRVDKILENLTSPYLLTLPTLGPRGLKYVAQGTFDAVLSMFKTRRLLLSKGLMPADQPFEAHRWMHEGLSASPIRELGSKALNGLNRFCMFAYQQTDMLTRGITYHTARRMAADMRAGNPGALHLLQEMDPGYQKLVAAKLEAGGDVTDDVAKWLNGYTQFNYNRASMSEYGRFMGHMFSTFSKWPTSIAGDFAYRVEKGLDEGRLTPEMMKLGMKYFAPLLSLYAADKALEHLADLSPEESGRMEMLIGKGGLSGLAPVGAIFGIVTSAPLPSLAADFWTADAEEIGSVFRRQFARFTPGGTLLRLWYRDLPGWIDDEPTSRAVGTVLTEDLGLGDD
jgi:hypothetical protein